MLNFVPIEKLNKVSSSEKPTPADKSSMLKGE